MLSARGFEILLSRVRRAWIWPQSHSTTKRGAAAARCG
jgi:hypothetical protein